MGKLTDNMPVLTRREASEKGLRTYWNGRPCAKGHEAVRYTASGSCSKCSKAHQLNAAAIRTARLASRRGLDVCRVFAYKADHATVEAFAAALVAARDLDGPAVLPAVAYVPGARTAEGVDIVPVLPDAPLGLDDTNLASRPVDFANC